MYKNEIESESKHLCYFPKGFRIISASLNLVFSALQVDSSFRPKDNFSCLFVFYLILVLLPLSIWVLKHFFCLFSHFLRSFDFFLQLLDLWLLSFNRLFVFKSLLGNQTVIDFDLTKHSRLLMDELQLLQVCVRRVLLLNILSHLRFKLLQ